MQLDVVLLLGSTSNELGDDSLGLSRALAKLFCQLLIL
jgi:hypothetical protein